MQVTTHIKADGMMLNHNETLVRAASRKRWLVSLTFVLLTFASSQAFAQTRYALTCRGGGGIWVDVNSSTAYTGSSVSVWFSRGTKPSYQGLNTGECTWSDRGMWSSEPNRLCMNNVAMKVSQWAPGSGGFEFLYFSFSSSTPDPVRNAINGLAYDWQYQTFYVYNDGNGCMRF
jgi:hypothetical protein